LEKHNGDGSRVRWLSTARAKLSTREAAGAANSPNIIGWTKKLRTRVMGFVYNAGSVPWCGLFVDVVASQPP
jgi:hypothetical protein